MRKLARRALTAIAATATTAALTAAPAAADPVTYTIQNGGYLTGSNVGSLVGFGWQTGFTFECYSSVLDGWTQKDMEGNPVVDGTLDGDNVVALGNASFSSPGEPNDLCSGAYGRLQVTPVGLPWKFVATGAGTGSGPGGTTDGQLIDIQLKLHDTLLLCDVTIGGSGAGGSGGYFEAIYTNPSVLTGSDGILDVPFTETPNFTVINISGPTSCPQYYYLGEKVSIAFRYNVRRTSPVPPAAGISPTID
ncbi:hypothetical protein [Actinomadura geliboluensis]|uniref:Secreted protein n=1 Tax=Actinomadura geliboluensis TaxID=882440 RepID=A0A5S4GC43_9ACTN|nr:hypothetical protein [Actinomadura geliboluensis]TMR30578.1 hypothetical protein ETD96_33460 [Actinomadura geliboluensis]